MSQPFDDQWRKSLDAHQSPLDADDFWSRLEPKLPPAGTPRRPIFWWWPGALSSLVAVAVISGALLYTANRAEDASFPSASTNMANSQHAEWASHADDDDLAIFTGEKTESTSEHLFTHATHTVTSDFNQFANTGNTLSTHPGPGTIRRAAAAPASQPEVEAASAMRVEQAGTVNSDDEPNSDAEAIPQVPPAPQPGLDPVATLDMLPLAIENQDMPTLHARTVRKGWQFFVDILSGPGYPSRELMAMEEAYIEHLMRRRSYEHPLESWSLGVDARLYAPSGLFLQAGIRRHQINERFESRHTESGYVWGLGDGLIQNSDGSTTPWQDTTWIWQTQEMHTRHLNRIITWDLPIAIGYRHVWGPWSGDIAAGVQTNLRQFAEGRSLDPEGRIVTWNETPDYTYRHQVGVSAILQGRLVWYPRTGYGLFVQPTWFLSPSSRTDAAVTGYEIRYHQLFVQTGLSMRFF